MKLEVEDKDPGKEAEQNPRLMGSKTRRRQAFKKGNNVPSCREILKKGVPSLLPWRSSLVMVGGEECFGRHIEDEAQLSHCGHEGLGFGAVKSFPCLVGKYYFCPVLRIVALRHFNSISPSRVGVFPLGFVLMPKYLS